jgi:hypothetical protein
MLPFPSTAGNRIESNLALPADVPVPSTSFQDAMRCPVG